jgi:hypothetical protein
MSTSPFPLPPGATAASPDTQATSGVTTPQQFSLPTGATPIDSTASTSTGNHPVLQTIGKILEIPQDLETGFVKGTGDTISGIGHLINKIPGGVGEALSPSVGLSALDKMDVSNGVAEAAGKGLENIAEFAAGDELLSGLSKGTRLVALAQKYPIVAKTLQLASEHPFLAKIISEGGKGAVVGATQGAVKGAQEDNATGGALSGATGGAIGGAIGGGIEELAAKANPIDSLTRAIRPTGKLAQNFADKAELALPRLAAEHASTPITNLDDLSDAAHSAANKLWNTEIVPQIQKFANEVIPGKPVADAIRRGVLAGDADLFPEAADAASDFAKKFDSDMSLQQASDRLQSLNRKLSSLYKLDPASRYAATANSPTVEAMESGANELRQQIYSKLESLGETDPAGLRKTYGALKTVEQAAEKRAVVVGRAAPLNLAQQLATVGGAMHAVGHLAVGDVPGAVVGVAPIAAAKATKVLNSPEHLIGNALNPEGGAIRALAQKAAMPVANIGSQAGQAITNSENEQQ